MGGGGEQSSENSTQTTLNNRTFCNSSIARVINVKFSLQPHQANLTDNPLGTEESPRGSSFTDIGRSGPISTQEKQKTPTKKKKKQVNGCYFGLHAQFLPFFDATDAWQSQISPRYVTLLNVNSESQNGRTAKKRTRPGIYFIILILTTSRTHFS